MAIYAPGKRDRKNKRHSAGGSRTAVVALSLTSMVDMFTILVVFLLQNYSSTGEIIYIPKDVKLPKASQTKELRPAHIVTLTQTDVVLDKETVAHLDDVKAQTDWMVVKLRDRLVAALQQDEQKAKDVQNLRSSLPGTSKPSADADNNPKKITVQADKDQDFLTIKKIMFTVTEAGAEEINFAVMKKEDPTKDGAAPTAE